MSISAFPIRGEDGSIAEVGAIIRDLGPRKALEEQLRVAQRMEAVGRLTGGIAQDFNNMLAVITGYAASAAADAAPGSQQADDLREVQAAADRATSLTRQLLTFSRQQVLDPAIVDLRDVIAVYPDVTPQAAAEVVVPHPEPAHATA